MQAKRKVNIRYGIQEMSFCQDENIFLLLTNNTVQIYDSELEGPIHTVKEDTPAKSAHLCRNGKYFFVHFSNNDIFLYDTHSGKKIQKIIGAPYCTKTVKFSGSGEKIIYGNTQLLCLWDILEGTMAMRTENWRNINCYDVNYAGDQIALGTYNGSIFVVSFVARTRCAQIEIKRHQHCIMAICYHKHKIVSVSHGGHLLISTITSNGEEKTISYVDKTLEHVPRWIESCGDVFYMFDRKGMFWQNPMGKMVGFVDGKSYRVIRNQNKQTIFIKYDQARIQWWPADSFTTNVTVKKYYLSAGENVPPNI